ncbi:GTP-binding protein HflX [Neisseria lactamica ATCC 23970]|uniref:GTP-binding protein HflX n=1 Tax=Neisseria lactamica ATCC 23970 TaxID=546265 RepID=D0W8P2_NEILA|nr:GTP-binding protein HflX [Neisseria lactamica ATCC 23970]
MSGKTGQNIAAQAQPERVMLVGVMLDQEGAGSSAARLGGFQTALAEAIELVKAAGGDPVLVKTAKRDRPHTALFVGTGKAAELSEAVAADGIDLVVFNHELTPTQERNLEKNPPMPRVGQGRADFGDFCPPRPNTGRQAASRVGAIEPFGGTLDTRLRTPAKPARRHRYERPRRNQTGNRPPIDRP